MANKTVVKKKSTAVVVVKKGDKKKDLWLGAQSFMEPVVAGSQKAKEREIIKMTARVLDVSPFGVNILGSVPYINKLGLGQKSNQYGKGSDIFVYNWVQRALNDTDKAICECKITRNGKDITDWITGECSPVTMKMGTLKGYQNHMAQTRAKNRAILEAYGVRIHEDMINNIAVGMNNNTFTPAQGIALADHVGRASSTSSEEMELEKNHKSDPLPPALFTMPPQVDGPDGEPTYLCEKCQTPVSEQEALFSKKVYKKVLCRDHQLKAKAVLSAKKK